MENINHTEFNLRIKKESEGITEISSYKAGHTEKSQSTTPVSQFGLQAHKMPISPATVS